jgi:hypothetical protein
LSLSRVCADREETHMAESNNGRSSKQVRRETELINSPRISNDFLDNYRKAGTGCEGILSE